MAARAAAEANAGDGSLPAPDWRAAPPWTGTDWALPVPKYFATHFLLLFLIVFDPGIGRMDNFTNSSLSGHGDSTLVGLDSFTPGVRRPNQGCRRASARSGSLLTPATVPRARSPLPVMALLVYGDARVGGWRLAPLPASAAVRWSTRSGAITQPDGGCNSLLRSSGIDASPQWLMTDERYAM